MLPSFTPAPRVPATLGAPAARVRHHALRTCSRSAGRVVALLVGAALLSGCVVTDADLEELRDAARPYLETSPPLPAALATPDEAQRWLDTLPVLERKPSGIPAYARAEFGRAWRDVDGNGCNQRDDVLARDAVAGSTTTAPQGACDHDVLAGTWLDPYSGETLAFDDLKDRAQAQRIQIDHVVPLAEAWRSGAWRWSPERRESFANDLDVLLAVDGPTNASKSDDDPAAWRPRAAYQCAYAIRWITVKHTWELAVDPSERAALQEMVGTCPA